MFFIILFLPVASLGIKDLCTPNPCGDNTRCVSTLSRTSPLISCDCLIGYQVPTGGDPFDGCIEQLLVPRVAARGGGSAATPRSATKKHGMVPVSTMPSITREVSDQPSAVARALNNDGAALNSLQTEERRGQLVQRRKTSLGDFP